MRHTVSLPLGFRPVLRAAAVSALLFGSALPAAAQVLIYEGQPGLAPRGYPVPPGAYPPGTYPPGTYAVPQARYPVLPPEEIRAIAQSMGYWNVGAPKLSGRFYLVAATDQEGRALLRVNAFTGRVVSARNIPGGPAVAAPAPYPAPQRAAPPATARAVPPPAPTYSAPAPAPAMAGTPAPLPPQRPPEATMAAVTPAPAAVAPSTPAPSTPAPAAPAATAPAASAAQPAPGASANAPAGQTAAQQSANAAPSATPAPPASAAQPQKRKAGAGTATTDSASAGTASVLSRPKGQ